MESPSWAREVALGTQEQGAAANTKERGREKSFHEEAIAKVKQANA